MRSAKLKAAAWVVGTLAIAAALGGSLGVVTVVNAGQKASLTQGVNPTVGGPVKGNVTPAKWVSCLPASSWSAVYLWDGANQRWLHYFNTGGGVPAYVNSANAGGITLIPRLQGVAMIMSQAVANPWMPDEPTEQCP